MSIISVGNKHLLPDSRLQRQDYGTVMVNWAGPSGGVERLELMPIFCASCSKPYGWVPRATTTFACWLCRECYEQYGTVAGTYAVPDDEFNRAVQAEVIARFGREMTTEELQVQSDNGRLGPALEALVRDSPYPH